MSKLRLIQAGVGGFGGGWVHHIVPASGDFQLVAIVDINPDALESAGVKCGVPHDHRFTDLQSAIGRVPADAVLSVTPPAVHLDHARLAFSAGLHLMVEKPIADSISSAIEMTRLAERADRQLVVSQNYRYRAAPSTLRALVLERALGDIGHGHIDFYIPADFSGSFRQSMRHVLLLDMAIHHIDMMRYITGRNVVKAFAQTFNPVWSWYEGEAAFKAIFTLEDGICFSYSGDWSARGRNTDWNGDWRIQCSDGSIHWSQGAIQIARSSRGFKADTTIESIEIPPLETEGQAATLASFAEAIRSGRPAATGGGDNLQSFGAVMAAVISAEQSRIVPLSEVLGQ